MPPKLYLVDGMSHIYRAYYAIQGLTNREGLPTNAVYGFTTMLRKLIHDEKPEYLGVAIDVSGPTVRHQKFEAYKATRPPMPEDLSQQLPYIRRVCEVLKVPLLSLTGYEADDVIGTLSAKAVELGLEVVIVSIDKDMFQLVTDRVTVLDTRSMTRFAPAAVEAKFGVHPEHVVDVLSLTGDSSDNIPGAPGIGEKGARMLIRQFGGLDRLLENAVRVAKKTYRESLLKHQDLIKSSRELIMIHRDLPIELDLKDLELSEPDRDGARELFSELGFSSLVEEFLPNLDQSELSMENVTEADRLVRLKESLSGRPVTFWFGFPTVDRFDQSWPEVGICDEAGNCWSVQADRVRELEREVVELLNLPGRHRIHDLKSLYLFSLSRNWKINSDWFDTMLMAYLVAPNQTNFSLERLSLEYLQTSLSTEGKSPAQAARNAAATHRLHEVLWSRLQELGMEKLLLEMEIPLVGVLAGMESRGVLIDVVLLDQMSRELESDIEDLKNRIYELTGLEFNLNSPRQLSEVLFEKLRLPVTRKTRKAGHFSTGVEVLEELGESFEVVRLLLEYRELSKLKSTYLDALPRLVNPRTGRVHTSYNQMVASTGRLSSSNPNLQNIPIRSEIGRRIRKAFVAPPGRLILAADYSQIELRILAHLSEDPVLIEAFSAGQDIHERTAREVFGMNAMFSPQEFRRRAKAINFGIIYGLSAFGLAQSLKIDRKEAQEFIDNYFARYRGVKAWIDRTLGEARTQGFVRTLFGRIRQIPEINSRNGNLRSFGERTAVNAPIQGTAADLIKRAMVALDSKLREQGSNSCLIMQVHDELVLEVPEREVDAMRDLVVREMERVGQLRVPLRADIGVGPSWYDVK